MYLGKIKNTEKIYSSEDIIVDEILTEKNINLSEPKKNNIWKTSNFNEQNFIGHLYLTGINKTFLKKKIGKNKFSLSNVMSSPVIGKDFIIMTDNTGTIFNISKNGKTFFKHNNKVLKKLGRINNFFDKDKEKPSATIVISGDIFKVYFEENVDLSAIKENLLNKQKKCQNEIDKINSRLNNKGFISRAPKHIVDQEKTNYNNLKNDIKKISLTVKSL